MSILKGVINNSGGGGGGTPGGTDMAVQVNSGGAFYGDAANLSYDKTTKFFGVQVAGGSALAPLHVAGAIGQGVPSPASLAYSLAVDTAVDSPSSYSVSQVDAPTQPSSPSVGFTYIDQPIDPGGYNAYENAYQPSGFTCYGQTITGNIYAYRNSTDHLGNPVRITNPNPIPFSVSDYVNDGSSLWTITVQNWSAPNGYADGFILYYSDPYSGTYWKDIGNTNNCTFDNFTNQDAYYNSSYPSNGGSWQFGIAQYTSISGQLYRSDFLVTSNTDGNVASAYMILNDSWGGLTLSGFVLQSNYGYVGDMGTNTSFNDWGESLPGDPSIPFSSYCFPYFNTSLSDGAYSSSAQNDGSGNYTASGSGYSYTIYEYRTNPANGIKYFTSGYGFTIYDNNDGQPFYWSIDITPGDGDGRVWVNGGGQGQDIGGATSFTDDGSAYGTPTTTPLISGYSGITRNFAAYGYITSPSLKYSSTHKDTSFMDNNPADGYMILHTLSGFGNAGALKIIESGSRGPGAFYVGGLPGQPILQLNTGLSDPTVTPSTLGFLSAGQTLNYNAWADKTINGTLVYSATYASAAVVFPNDGLYRIVNLTIGAVSGAAYKVQKVGTGFLTTGSTSLQDSTATSWPASSTVTPTSSPVNAIIAERSMTSESDIPAVVVSNTSGGTVANSGIAFAYGGGNGPKTAQITVSSSGYMQFINQYSNRFDFGPQGSPHVFMRAATYNSAAAMFNAQGSQFYVTQMRGYLNQYLLCADAQSDAVYLGTTYNNFPGGDPSAILAISPASGDMAIAFDSGPSFFSDSNLMKAKDQSGQVRWTQTKFGKVAFATSSSPIGVANVLIGASTSSESQLVLQNSSTLPSPAISGGIEYQSGAFYGTDNTNTRRKFTQNLSAGTSGQFWRSDASGNPIADSAIALSGGIVSFNSSNAVLFNNGFSVSSGKNITMGGGASYLGGVRTSFATGTTNTSLNIANHSPIFVFTGSTANQTLTLPSATSIGGSIFEVANESSVNVTMATTSSQNININTGTLTTIILHPGDRIKFIATNSSSWDVASFTRCNPMKFTHFVDANNGTTVETDLFSDTIAAGQLTTNGDCMVLQYAGTFVGDATSTQRVRAYFAGTLIFDTTAQAIGTTAKDWDLCITIIRASSSEVRCSARFTSSFASLSSSSKYTKITGLTLTNTQIAKITGTAAGATGASNQITATMGYVKYEPVT